MKHTHIDPQENIKIYLYFPDHFSRSSIFLAISTTHLFFLAISAAHLLFLPFQPLIYSAGHFSYSSILMDISATH